MSSPVESNGALPQELDLELFVFIVVIRIVIIISCFFLFVFFVIKKLIQYIPEIVKNPDMHRWETIKQHTMSKYGCMAAGQVRERGLGLHPRLMDAFQ